MDHPRIAGSQQRVHRTGSMLLGDEVATSRISNGQLAAEAEVGSQVNRKVLLSPPVNKVMLHQKMTIPSDRQKIYK